MGQSEAGRPAGRHFLPSEQSPGLLGMLGLRSARVWEFEEPLSPVWTCLGDTPSSYQHGHLQQGTRC